MSTLQAELTQVDVSWLTEDLAMGGRWPPEAAPLLVEQWDIRHVVDMRSEACDDNELLRQHGMTLLHLPTEDRCACTLEVLERGVKWVNGHLDSGRRVLVHCEHGIGRSALLSLCILVSRGHEPLEALELARRVRSRVSPSPAQLLGYIEFLRHLRERERVHWQVPTLEDLGRIAWSRTPVQPT